MKRIFGVLFFAATMMVGMAGTGTAAPPPFTTICENPGGNLVQGQCVGQPLVETNLNPAGKAPPGQN